MRESFEINPEFEFSKTERNIGELAKIPTEEESFLEEEKEKIEKQRFFDGIKNVVRRAEERKKGLARNHSKEARKELRKINIEDATWINQGMEYILKHKDNPKAIKKFWEDYNFAFREEKDLENCRNCKSGILTGLATKEILEKLDIDFNYSDPEEDVDYKIDGWGTPPKNNNNILFAIQIKGRSWEHMTDEERKILEYNSMVKVFNERDLHQKNIQEGETKEEIKFKKGCLRWLSENKEQNNKEFIAMFITLPTGKERPNSPKKFINDFGEPRNKVKEIFKRQFEKKITL